MKIVVFGGSGLIGSKLIDKLSGDCREVVSASRMSTVNTVTDAGIAEALAGADVVVDLTHSAAFADRAVQAGVKHHIGLSTVGAERMKGSSYFRATMTQEKLIREAPIPYTILRSTQFFECLRAIADAATIERTVYLSPALFQPLASADGVTALVDITLGAPVNGIVEVAGPEQFSLAELVRRFLTKTGDPRRVEADVHAPYFGAVVDDRSLLPGPNPCIGSQSFAEWFSKTPYIHRD